MQISTTKNLRPDLTSESRALIVKRSIQSVAIKRILDLTLIFIFSPILLLLTTLTALAIWISNGSPIFFCQERVGKEGEKFQMWKFRTMRVGAEEELANYLKKNPLAMQEWKETYKLKNDPRITFIGRLLRKTSLDELPQIYNVLTGEMSLVGPRPVTPEEIQIHYKNKAKYYVSVLPGMTGYWQVFGRNEISYDERVSRDAYYVKHWSLFLDLKILAYTFYVVLRGKGAY